MTDQKKKDELHVRSYDVRSRTWHGVRKRTGEEDVDCYLEPMQDGAPLEDGDEILSMSPGRPGVMELESHYVHKGPARVASPAYRDNWDQIFGRTKRDKKNDTVLN
jgi:hypothetical protein